MRRYRLVTDAIVPDAQIIYALLPSERDGIGCALREAYPAERDIAEFDRLIRSLDEHITSRDATEPRPLP